MFEGVAGAHADARYGRCAVHPRCELLRVASRAPDQDRPAAAATDRALRLPPHRRADVPNVEGRATLFLLMLRPAFPHASALAGTIHLAPEPTSDPVWAVRP